ncbi:STAS domain [Dillenia turbinata]|uniref:STAS domain n=1 Tax=Dillenia turbinata TaxID=194707 RepID=A0AAN8ZN85_9MAGN
MASLSIETLSMEEQRNARDALPQMMSQRSQWVLSPPDPPTMCHEFIASIKETVFPLGNKNKNKLSSSSASFSKEQQSRSSGVFSFLQAVFPILSWGRNYKASMFKNDLLAGLTLASLSIPQSIGYAGLAKLDPQYGLYTSVVPPLIYALMGSSREIAIGPVAVVSLLLSSMVPKLQDPMADPAVYRKLVFTVTFFAGIFQAIFGLLRLGFLVDFLSHAAVVGFMGGAAIVIGLQQLKGLLGISHFTTKTDVISVIQSVWDSLHQPWYPLNFVIGSLFLIFILATRFVGRRNRRLFWLPAIAPLVSVILSTLIVVITKSDKHGVKTVKHVKGGINPSSAHQLQLNGPHVGGAAKIGLITAIVALTEAIAVGRSFASVKGYHLDGNKEMMAMGFTNIAGSLTSCYVATGSFSRTAVNFSAGCQTAVSNIVMAITVFLSLELLTRLLYYTPIAILASIILSALPGLIDINEARHIWKVDKLDFLACLGAFFGVLFASVEIGLLAAVMISFAKILLNAILPGTEVLGKLPGTDVFCDVIQYPAAITTSGIMMIRINCAFLCFANANFIRERILRRITNEEDVEKGNPKPRIQAVILDLSYMMNMDTSGIIALEELHKNFTSRGIELAIANPRWQVIHKLKLAKFVDKIGAKWVFLTVSEAMDSCLVSKLATPSSC